MAYGNKEVSEAMKYLSIALFDSIATQSLTVAGFLKVYIDRMEKGKEHAPCDAWNKKIGAMNIPRFGCGLCQVKVPCESKNPTRK